MRLIDADAINFEEAFGGQSDFAKDIREAVQELIERQPTAFDKGKVIEELKEEGCIIDNEAGNRAVEIIEKGGISMHKPYIPKSKDN